jgi:hypothetical protein
LPEGRIVAGMVAALRPVQIASAESSAQRSAGMLAEMHF